jgi:hypothetical protein
MIILRFILRFVLVPFGGIVAAVVAAVVACVAHWTQFTKIVANDPNAPENIVLAVLTIGPAFVAIMSVGAFAMLMPASVGALISEIFAIRSWMFHTLNGALASWLGWLAMDSFLKQYDFYSNPMLVVGAGIAAGFAYWAVAGWSAGFWKPVFAVRPSPPGPPTIATV